MRIALVHDPLYKLGGAEKVLEAIHELYPGAPLFTPLFDPVATGGRYDDWDVRTSFLQKMPGRISLINFYRALMPLAIEQWDLSPYDLVISSSTSVAKGVITRQDAVHISYIHNVTRFAWYDLEEHISGVGFRLTAWPARMALSKFRQWDYLAADRPDHIIANSRNTAAKIQKYYRRKTDAVISPFVDLDRFSISDKVDDYFLIVSRLEPHKKVDVAVEAFNELGLSLTIVGTGPEEGKLRGMAKNNITFLGRQSDAEVARLTAKCHAFLYPQEEDFGITALEAMASGRPVLAYQKGGAQETVIPGVTGEFFSEQTAASLKKAVAAFNPKRYTPKVIRQHAEAFTKKTFQDRFAQFVERSLKEHGIG